MYQIDMNCDLGESFGAYHLGMDRDVLPLVTSANIACGFHAGDPSVMHQTVKLAMENKTAIGAHPGLPDLQGFGRRRLEISAQEAYDMVVYQVGALRAFVEAEGGRLQHVKPHGALYNMAAKDRSLADGIAEAVYKVDPQLILYGLAGSESIKAAQRIGLRPAAEVFADRTYQPDGSLTPRRQPGAMIDDAADSLAQVLGMVKDHQVKALGGQTIAVQADTICIHGDGPQALLFVRTLREALEKAGVAIKPTGAFIAGK